MKTKFFLSFLIFGFANSISSIPTKTTNEEHLITGFLMDQQKGFLMKRQLQPHQEINWPLMLAQNEGGMCYKVNRPVPTTTTTTTTVKPKPTSNPPSGFQGANTGIGSWFKAHNSGDSTNGNR